MLVYRFAPIGGLFHKCSRCKNKKSNWKQFYRSCFDEKYIWLCSNCVKSLSARAPITPTIEALSVSCKLNEQIGIFVKIV